ncbi:MAG: M10 family metallopeptidase C-terminal domain-containing protein [Hyphomicrobiaceae bacterium]
MTGLFGQIESDVEGVAVNLGAGVATWSVVLNSNVYIDTLQSIENAIGTAYDDQLLGSDVANRLEGRGGSDEIRGFGGADTLEGGGGNDTIHGGTGGDTIIGGRGSDVLYGEAGGDTFVFRNGDGFDRIADFEQGQDLIDFSAMGLTFADISISTSKGFVSISAEDVSITVTGAAASQFDASDFVF